MTDEQIVNTYADMVYRIAYGYVRNEADRNDIFQDVFLIFFKKKRRFDNENHLKAWLIRVTINCAKNMLAKRMETVPLEGIHESTHSYEDDAIETVDLLDAISKLPEETRNIIYMYYCEDMSVGEIAETLTINKNTVMSKLARGRGKLKHFLGEGSP